MKNETRQYLGLSSRFINFDRFLWLMVKAAVLETSKITGKVTLSNVVEGFRIMREYEIALKILVESLYGYDMAKGFSKSLPDGY